MGRIKRVGRIVRIGRIQKGMEDREDMEDRWHLVRRDDVIEECCAVSYGTECRHKPGVQSLLDVKTLIFIRD